MARASGVKAETDPHCAKAIPREEDRGITKSYSLYFENQETQFLQAPLYW